MHPLRFPNSGLRAKVLRVLAAFSQRRQRGGGAAGHGRATCKGATRTPARGGRPQGAAARGAPARGPLPAARMRPTQPPVQGQRRRRRRGGQRVG
ncbi:hypothetical protein BHM03_00051511 [Ensete ventricosum]|nr:hypothetical protein BHM03_00051511 [Ensete ventricosum]